MITSIDFFSDGGERGFTFTRQDGKQTTRRGSKVSGKRLVSLLNFSIVGHIFVWENGWSWHRRAVR